MRRSRSAWVSADVVDAAFDSFTPGDVARHVPSSASGAMGQPPAARGTKGVVPQAKK